MYFLQIFFSIQQDLKLKNVLDIPKTVPDQKHKEFSDEINNLLPYINEGGSWKDVPYEELPLRHQKIRDNMKKYRAPNFLRI